MTPRHLIPVLLATALLAGCSDDSPTRPPADPDILLTLELNAFFMEAFADQGTVFASDPQGNVLDVATWDGPATIVLKNSVDHPDTISFTFVQSNDWELALATEVGVPAGTFWTYSGTLLPPHSGSAEIEFTNVPPHEGFMISSNWAASTGPGQLPPRKTIEIFGESTDCFVRVDPLDAPPVGGWLRGVRPAMARTLDFNARGAVAPLTATQVQLPAGGDHFLYIVYGSATADSFRYTINLDGKTIEGPTPRSITVYTPEYHPYSLHTMFYHYSDGNPGTYYSQGTVGPVPGEFVPMEGDLTVTSTSPDSLMFTTTSNWDRFAVSWSQQQGLYGHWYVEGRAPVREFALPKLPAELVAQYPDYPVQGFALNSVEIFRDGEGGMVMSQGKHFPSPGQVQTYQMAPGYTGSDFISSSPSRNAITRQNAAPTGASKLKVMAAPTSKPANSPRSSP